MLAAAMPALAGPEGGNVVGGNATIAGQGGATVTVTQSSDRAIINWNTFNVGAGEVTRFNQPSTSAVTLNRVTGGQGPSQIYGTISANGRVFLINRDGILFGPSAVVDTSGFLATTHDIRNDDFMAGRYVFGIPGRDDASIVNQGTITAHNAGFAALVAPGVRNSGTITANLGVVSLASGNGFTLDFYGDRLITLGISDSIAANIRDVATGQPLTSLVRNDGKLKANGGRVELSAVTARRVVDSVINNTGVVEANSFHRRGGTIVLSVGTGAVRPVGAKAQVYKQTVKLSGTLSTAAKNKGRGGTVVVTGQNIEVAGAHIDVSGPAGGGTVMIGGDWSGAHPDTSLVSNPSARLASYTVPTATTVTVDGATVIDASATQAGHGGKVIVWADGANTFAGTILARGGVVRGDGGFVETSGHQTLNYTGNVDTRAPMGKTGTLLLDPADIFINQSFVTPPFGSSQILVNDIVSQLATSNVSITTNNAANPGGSNHGDIFLSSGVNLSWTGNNSLTLNAFRNVTFADNVRITHSNGTGNFIVRADSTGNGDGTIAFNQATNGIRVDFTNSTGKVSFLYNPSSGTYAIPNDFTPTTQGPGRGVLINSSVANQFTAYMLVNSRANLDTTSANNISLNMAGTYALGRDINGAGPALSPISAIGTGFTGVLDGQGHTISKLVIAPTLANANNVGLFATIAAGGTVRNLNLANVSVTANPNLANPGQFIGTIAGQNAGTIDHVSVKSGAVNGGSLTAVVAGGLVGQVLAGGVVSFSDAAVNVTVGNGDAANNRGNVAGGLVGRNAGTVTSSNALGVVGGGFDSIVGGLVGQNGGSITTSFAASAVGTATGPSSASESLAGGLVGLNTGLIADSNASGPVGGSGNSNSFAAVVGGLVGLNTGNGRIVNSQASGMVAGTGTSQTELGGLVGRNVANIENSFATGNVTTTASNAILGGFVGLNASGGLIVNSHAGGIVSGGSLAGGFVGLNEGGVASSFATGAVGTTVTAASLGGFVGTNDGVVIQSNASGAVSATGDSVFLGGFAGTNNGGASITNSFATGNVTASGAGAAFAGGFVGVNSGSIDPSFASGNVTVTGFGYAGGFAGMNVGDITTSFATGNVTLNSDSSGYAGGFAGVNAGPVSRSFATGAVTGSAGNFLGGFAGLNLDSLTQVFANGPVTGGAGSIIGGLAAVNLGSIDQAYATGLLIGGTGSKVGGLVAANSISSLGNAANDPTVSQSGDTAGVITNSYWDIQRTGVATSDGGTGLTTAQLISGLPPGFDPAVWTIKPGQTYPYLTSPAPNPLPVPREGSFDFPPSPPQSGGQDALPPSQPDFRPLQITQTQQIADLWRNADPTPTVIAALVTTPPPPRRPQRPNVPPPANQQIAPRAESGVPPPGETRFIQDQVVFQVGGDVPAARIAIIARQLGLELISSQALGLIDRTVYQFRITNGQSVADVIRRLEALRVIAAAQPNYVFELAQAPPTPAPPPASEGDPAQYIIAKLRLPELHRLGRGTNIKVAVVDSEIDRTHPDLEGVIADRFSAVGAEGKPHPHGTGMAGAIASHRRLLGVAPGARILAVQAFGPVTTGGQGTSMQIVKGLDWALSQNARVINMSFAGPKDPLLTQAVKVIHDKGVVLIAAAGNAGPTSPPLFPGADPNVIAVTATDASDRSYTNANRGRYVAVAAPGVDILVPAPEGGYQLTTGTSVAAAHVSGVAALLLEKDPKLTPDEIRSILTSTAKTLGTRTRDDEFGYGLVDPIRALNSVNPRASSLDPASAPLAAAVR